MITRDEIREAFRLPPDTGSLLPESFPGVSTDSRTVRPGELFFALRGERFDGHDFVDEVFSKGAGGVVVDRAWIGSRPGADRILTVADTLEALQGLAKAHRAHWKGRLVAITGSNGKTTTKDMTAAVLASRYAVHGTRGNLNNHIGLPLTLLGLSPEHAWAVAELGMNHPGEIGLLASLAVPGIAVITNAGPAHLEGVGTVEDVIRAKLELVDHTEGPVVVHGDNEVLLRETRKRASGRIVTFGFGEEAEVRASSWQSMDGKTMFVLNGNHEVILPVAGKFNVLNALAALAVAGLAEVPVADAVRVLGDFRGTAMRFELVTVGRCRVVNDAYNANPDSMRASLNAFSALRAPQGETVRKVAVLGSMNELGPESPRFHREIGAAAREAGIDFLLGIGELAREIVAGFDGPSAWYASAEEAARNTAAWNRPGDMILLKGSRTLNVEKVLGGLQNAA